MLGWFGLPQNAPEGRARLVLAALCRDLAEAGLRVSGAAQVNSGDGTARDCDMDLVILGDETRPIRISQSLGPGAESCRLDLGALETAAGRIEARLDGAELLVLPKFGAQEALGRGFRSVIAKAVAEGIPVLLHVPLDQRPAFAEFAGDLAEEIAPDRLLDWCMAQVTGTE